MVCNYPSPQWFSLNTVKVGAWIQESIPSSRSLCHCWCSLNLTTSREAQGCDEIHRSLLRSQWLKSRYHFLFYHDSLNLFENKKIVCRLMSEIVPKLYKLLAIPCWGDVTWFFFQSRVICCTDQLLWRQSKFCDTKLYSFMFTSHSNLKVGFICTDGSFPIESHIS